MSCLMGQEEVQPLQPSLMGQTVRRSRVEWKRRLPPLLLVEVCVRTPISTELLFPARWENSSCTAILLLHLLDKATLGQE